MTEQPTLTPDSDYEFEMQLRWSDQDALGHVNNARIVTLMEEARMRFLRELSGGAHFDSGLVVASMKLDYLRQVDYRPTMMLRVGVERLGTKSFTLRHVGYIEGERAFESSIVLVPLDEDGKSSRAMTPTERGWLEGSMLSVRV